MDNDKCIRETGRMSFIPGKKDNYCLVAYKDGDCNCIADARLMHFNRYADSVGCETKMVEGYSSYHFQRTTDMNSELDSGYSPHADRHRENVHLWDAIVIPQLCGMPGPRTMLNLQRLRLIIVGPTMVQCNLFSLLLLLPSTKSSCRVECICICICTPLTKSDELTTDVAL
jgi:hypothetical protein